MFVGESEENERRRFSFSA